MHARLSRRSLLALAPGLTVAPALAVPARAFAQGTPAATPRAASPDDLLANLVAHGAPGVTMTISRAGETMYSGAAGVASLEDQTPLELTDRFRIYSITKVFVATIVLQLADEGILSLDDTVAQWLDDPAVRAIPNVDTATVRQLLHHTSGIYDYLDSEDTTFYDDAFFSLDSDWSKVWTLPELLAYASADYHDPYFSPGEGAHYSNTEYLLLGMIVEQATGNTFEDELSARILTPLALSGTSMEMGAALPADVADAYQVIEGELVNVTAVNLTWSWTGGGMVSTAADLTRFADSVFSGELLSPASFDEMFTWTPDLNYGVEGFEWGAAVNRYPTPVGVIVGKDGDGAGGTAFMRRLIDEEVTVVLLANVAPDDGTILASLLDAFAWALESGA
jgi:CubicO group peptidase (beta-lactamase class C family)